MARRAYTVGIVGLGFGRAHIPAFQSQGCQVVALCQRRVESAREMARRYGVPGVFESWERMLAGARPDIVVVATPPALHREIAVGALAAGAHVLCEKPLALDAEEGRLMAEAARAADRVAMTCFNWRFPAAMQRVRAMVQEGVLGRVLHLGARYLVPRWADESVTPTWRMDRAQAGHGAMGDLGVHLIDMVRGLFGEFRRVSAQAGIAYPERTVPGGARAADTEDFCTVMAELVSGAHATLTVSRAARAMNEQTLEVFGTQGALRYRLLRGGGPRWYRGELRVAAGAGGLVAAKFPTGLPRSAGEGDQIEVVGKATIAPLVRRLLQGIRRGETPSPSFEDGLRAQIVLDAVLGSTRRGGWVDVEGV
jgi:predicted dehydrogenase